MAEFPKHYGKTIFNGVLSYGAAGVDIFFVIIGFIISVFALQDDRLTTSINISSFFAKRFAYIVPFMWLSILLFLLLRKIVTTTEITLLPYFRAAFLTPYGNVEPNSIWTLRHELVFYAVFAVSFLGRKPLRWLMWAWIAASSIIPIATLGFWGGMDDAGPIQIIYSPVKIEFAARMFLDLLWTKNPSAADWQLGINPFILLAVLNIAIMPWVGQSDSNRSVPEIALLAIMMGAPIWIAARLRCPPQLHCHGLDGFWRMHLMQYIFSSPFFAALLLFGS